MNIAVPRIIKVALLAVVVSITGSPSKAAPNDMIASQQSFGDSIIVQKQVTSKLHRIRIYPDAAQDVLFFSVRGEQGKVYQLFLFDVEGHLVKQANIRNKQTTLVNKIDKGTYLFEVFSDDERIENGQVIVL